MMATTEIDLTADIIDLSEITDRVETLGAIVEDKNDDTDDDAQELNTLASLLADLRGAGGDHQWRGDWYPGALIRDSYMEDYARETADDLYGAEMRAAQWPFSYIDWDAATDAFKQDYSAIEIDGIDYWYR